MITISECKISSDNSKLLISAITTVGNVFTEIKLWNENTFKIFSKAKNLPIQGTSNQENLIIEATSLGLKNFNGIYFIEFSTNEPALPGKTCSQTVTSVVTNLIPYYRCAMDSILKSTLATQSPCLSCLGTDDEINRLIAINLLIDGINQAVEINRFVDAINMLNSLKKLCVNCSETSTGEAVNCSECSKTSTYYN